MGKAPAHLRLQPRVRCPLSLQPALRSPPGHLGEAVLSSGPGHPPALCSWRLYPCPSSVFPVPRIDSIFQHLSLWAADSSTRRSALEGAGVLSQLLRFVSFPRLPPVKAQGGARAGAPRVLRLMRLMPLKPPFILLFTHTRQERSPAHSS